MLYVDIWIAVFGHLCLMVEIKNVGHNNSLLYVMGNGYSMAEKGIIFFHLFVVFYTMTYISMSLRVIKHTSVVISFM